MHKSKLLDGNRVREMIRIALTSGEGGHVLHRLDCVLLVSDGRSYSEVADWFGVDRRTIKRWVHAAYVRGVDGLVKHRSQGRPAKLLSQQMQRISLDLLASPGVCGYQDPKWTGKRLALHLDKCYGVSLSIRSCQRMISRSHAGLAWSTVALQL